MAENTAMPGYDGPIDEANRRRFEKERRGGGTAPIESYLPPAGHPSRPGTLEELVCIELEFAIKRDASTAPTIADFIARFPELADPEIEARLAEEFATIREARTRTVSPLASSPGHAAARDGTAAAVSPVSPMAGDRIGRYELDEPVGRGAFAQVWRARDTELHRTVAIKITRPDLAMDPDARARVHREARSAAQLRHPGIVPVYDVVEWHGCPCIVSEFVAGDTMASRLAGDRPDTDTAARWIADLADALHYAHQCGVVHRDVKPGNVMMSEDGRPMLTDFGLAQLADSELTLTQQGDVLGTPAYLSPEQALGANEKIDAKSDVFSLGVMLYEVLTGVRPFERGTTAALLYATIHEEPPPPRTRAAGIPLDLETICLVAMAKERDRRFASAAALAADLQRFLAREPIHARRLSPMARVVLWTRRHPGVAATIAVGVCAVAVVAVVGYVGVLRELYRSRVGQIGSVIVARDSQWHTEAQRVLTQAASMSVRDVRELRDLALGIHASRYRWLECVGEWSVRNVRRLAMSSDGEAVAMAARDGSVEVRSIATGDVVARRKFDARSSIAFVRDRDVLVVGASESLFLWSFRQTGEPRAIPFDGLAIHALAAGADFAVVAGADLEAGTNGSEHVLRIAFFDTAATQPTRSVEGHVGGTHALAVSPDGERFATGGEDKTIRVVDVASGAVLATGQTPNPVRFLAFAANGPRVLWTAWEIYGFGVFNYKTSKPSVNATPLHEDAVRSVIGVSSGASISASADGTVRAWRGNYEQVAIARADAGSVIRAAGSPTSDRVVAYYADETVRVWELRESPFRRFVMPTNCVAFVPGTKRFFVGSGEYRIPDARSRVEHRSYPGHDEDFRSHGPIWGLDVSPDGEWLVTAAHDGYVAIRDAQQQERVHGIATGWETGWSAAFRPDSQECTVGFEEGMITFDPATGKELRRLTGHERLVVSLAYHPRYPVLISTSYDWTIRAWDARSGAALGVLARESAVWHEAKITKDGRFLAVAGGDAAVRVWDLAAPALARTFAAEPLAMTGEVSPTVVLRGQSSAVWSVAFTANGRHLLVGTQNGRVAIYSVPGFVHLTTFAPGVRMIRALSFSPDGRWLVVGCYGQESLVLDFAGLREELGRLGLDW